MAVLDNNTGLLRITWTQYSNFQPLVFTAGGTSFQLTANAQIWPRSLNSLIGGTLGDIYLVVNDIGSPSGSGLDFINGYTFLKRFYSVFDTKKLRMATLDSPRPRSLRPRRIERIWVAIIISDMQHLGRGRKKNFLLVSY
jgi:cathepsin E